MTGYLRTAFAVLSFLVCVSLGAQEHTAVKYLHITDMSMLRDGDEIIFVSDSCSVAMSKYQDKKKEYFKPCSVSLNKENNTATCETDSVAVFKLEKLSNGWRLHNDEYGWLSTKASPIGSITYASMKGEKRNLIELDINSQGNARVKFKNIETKEYDWLNYNGNSQRFARYNRSDSYYKLVQIYRRLTNPTVVEAMTLGEENDNAELLKTYKDAYVRSLTIDRTFRADGGYYTLCLPVDLTEEEVRTVFYGMQFKELKSVEEIDLEDKVVFSFISRNAATAGKPYLVRLLLGTDKDVVKPEVKNKFLFSTQPSSWGEELSAGKYSFIGTYSPKLIPANGRYRFLSSDGKKLTTPNTAGYLKGLRAYFVLPEPWANVGFDSNGEPKKIAISIDGVELSDAETTAILGGELSPQQADHRLYNMAGQYVGKDPSALKKGVYVRGGRKIVVE